MIDARDFESVMEGWAEYCLEGCGHGLGYPSVAAFMNDYIDNRLGPRVPIDDHPMLDDIEKIVAKTAEINERVPDVLRAHYKAQRRWLEKGHSRKLKLLKLSNGDYYKYLNSGKCYIQGALSAKYQWDEVAG